MPGSTTSTTFVWKTSAFYSFAVPTSVFFLTAELWGGSGGSVAGVAGGKGGYIRGTIPVIPGEVLRVYVGTAGWNQASGGAPVGGQNGAFGSGQDGGGESGIRRAPYATSNYLIVAGGGGSAGERAIPNVPGAGGSGGYPVGQDGSGFAGALPGGGGTASAGGAGGVGSDTTGSSGVFISGGVGGDGVSSGGGGGGSGYYGGGGGGRGSSRGGGGGGGSSAIPGGTLVAASTIGTWSGNGVVTLTYSTQEQAPARTSDIPWWVANDRYQTVVLSRQGTSTTAPEFRYWYAAAPEWPLDLNE